MSIIDLKNIHVGRLCFIYGGGPSLSHVDETKIKSYISITVNSGFLKNKDCDYFVSDDCAISGWSYFEDIWKYRCKKLLYKDRFFYTCKNKNDVIFYPHTWWYSPSDKQYNLDGLKLNKDGPVVGARTSMGSAVHLAYIMGCNPVVLLGNDCNIVNGNRYFWQSWEKSKWPYRVKGGNFNKKSQNMGFDQKSFIEYWNSFSYINKKYDILGKDINIIDCSDSILDCFPKMNINEIIEKYGRD